MVPPSSYLQCCKIDHVQEVPKRYVITCLVFIYCACQYREFGVLEGLSKVLKLVIYIIIL
jgi:hypothetical protein